MKSDSIIENLRWQDLTVHQRITLKGLFVTDEELSIYRAVWILWDYRKAIDLFFNDSRTNELSISAD
jgi:hypothetical protein